ncbi:MAG: hemerythrin domain-containing protein [Pseudomonadota bacterium]
MITILEFLGTDHHQCDAHFAAAETAVAEGRWDVARAAAGRFLDAMARHLAMEEDVLFPAFEARTGMQSGPTAVMRMEHAQMRELMDGLAQAVEANDATRFLGLSETLNMLMQQHNLKEENMLYPMADRVLGDSRDGLLDDMQACGKPHPV